MADKAIPRYLALDVGSKRIGIAVSDELGLTAQPVLTLERRRNAARGPALDCAFMPQIRRCRDRGRQSGNA